MSGLLKRIACAPWRKFFLGLGAINIVIGTWLEIDFTSLPSRTVLDVAAKIYISVMLGLVVYPMLILGHLCFSCALITSLVRRLVAIVRHQPTARTSPDSAR